MRHYRKKRPRYIRENRFPRWKLKRLKLSAKYMAKVISTAKDFTLTITGNRKGKAEILLHERYVKELTTL